MRIAQGVDEVAHAQVAGLRHHVGEQRVAGDVERHAEEDVAAALVKLATEPPIDHVELEQAVARHQRHLRQLGHVPGRHQQPARVRVAPDLLDHPLDLVDLDPVGTGPAAPLLAIHRAQLAIGIGPLVPDADLVRLEVGDVGVALQEPQQLVHDRAQVQLLGGQQRKTLRQVEAHLPAEHAARSGTGAVGFLGALFQHVGQQFQVLLHGLALVACASGAMGTTGCKVGERRESHSSNSPSTISGTLSSWPMVNQPKAR